MFTPRALQGDTYGFCGVGLRKTWAHAYRTGNKSPQVLSSCVFAPTSDERGAAVTLTLETASKASTPVPCTNVPIKCLFGKEGRWVWKYCMANHVQKEHAAAFEVRAEDIVVLAFRALHDVNATEKQAVKKKLQLSYSRKCRMRGASVTIRPRKKSGGDAVSRKRQQTSAQEADSSEAEEEEEDDDDDKDEDEDGDDDEEEEEEEEEDEKEDEDEDEEKGEKGGDQEEAQEKKDDGKQEEEEDEEEDNGVDGQHDDEKDKEDKGERGNGEGAKDAGSVGETGNASQPYCFQDWASLYVKEAMEPVG